MSVLDNIIKIRALEQEQNNQMVESLLKGITLAQDSQKTGLLADIEKKKSSAEMLRSGIVWNPDTGEASSAPESILSTIKDVRGTTYADVLKGMQVEKGQADLEDKRAKGEVMAALNIAEDLPADATPEVKTAWMQKLPPIAQETIQGLTSYQYDPSKFASLRSDERTKYLALARKYDPSFNMMEYPKRQKYLNSISDPSTFAGRNIISLNTLAHHLTQLDEEIEANKGVNFKPTQTALNWAREVSGDPSITDEKIAQKVVKDELEKALAGTVTQEALRDFDKVFNANTGYNAKKNAIKTFVKIVKGRIQPYREQFKQVLKRDEAGEIINPESQSIFDKYLAPAKESGKSSGGIKIMKIYPKGQ